MTGWHAHRLWMGILAAALVIGVGHGPLTGLLLERQKAELDGLQDQYQKSQSALAQLKSDIAATEKLKSQMGEEEAEKSLAAVDRLRAAQALEHRAGESRLTHFSYTLSPERKTQIDTVGAGKQDLAIADLSVTADAPTDLDGYAFIDAVHQALPGRIEWQSFMLERIGAANAPVTAANLHLTARAEWLSNGATQNLAEISR